MTSVPLTPSGVVTTTSLTVPGESAGVWVKIVLSSKNVTVVATPPMVMVIGSAKSVPKAKRSEPPAGGPDVVLSAKMIRCENSDVLPPGSVAVAEMRAPASTVTGRLTSKAPVPATSVVTWPEPMYDAPSMNSRGVLEHAGFS